MRWTKSLGRRLRSVVSKESSNVALREELQFHLERTIEENLARGLPEEDAVAAAKASFGSWVGTTEQCYQARGTALIDDFLQDLRYGLRTLTKHRSFSVLSILTLAMGIGACAAIFSIFDAVLLRSLPYGNPTQLVYLYTPSRQLLRLGVPAEVFNPSFADFFDLRKQSHSLEIATLFQQTSFNLAAGGKTERVGAARVDADFFGTLESEPQVGRAINAGDQQQGNDRVAIVSHALWQEMFAGGRKINNSTLRLDGTQYQIVGVMPTGFEYPQKSDLPAGFGNVDRTQIWVPIALNAQQLTCRDSCGAFAVARLNPGITLRDAETDLSTIMERLDSLHNPQMRDFEVSLRPLLDVSVGPVRPLMRLLMGAVGLVLLIACANAANLLLARAATRAHEVGVRTTLGARRERLFRQMLTESLLLSLAAGCAGAVFAWLFLHGLLRLNPGDIPRIDGAKLDLRVLGFLAGITVLASLLFGILPSSLASRINLVQLLKRGGMRGLMGEKTRVRSGLAITQIALLVVLLTGTGLLLRSYAKVLAAPLGFSPSTITASIEFNSPLGGTPTNSRYNTPEKRRAFFAETLDWLQHAPGVYAAGWIDLLPFSNSELAITSIEIEGSPVQNNQFVETRRVSSGYFSAMEIPFIGGRTFGDNDGRKDLGEVIVNQALAKLYFGRGIPIGRRIRMSPQDPWLTIVGVISDVRNMGPETSPAPQIYTWLWQTDTTVAPANSAYVAVRSMLPEAIAAQEIRNAIERADSDLAIAEVHTMRGLESEATARRRFQTVLLTSFSAVAMVLALIGVYGLLAFSVRQRTGEIAVRMALGSTRKSVLGLILRQGLVLFGAGLGIGITGSIALTRLISGFLYGVRSIDPETYVIVSCLLLGGTVAASLVPGFRAAVIDPMSALRNE